MEHRYLTMDTLSKAEKELDNPASYFCTPQKLILCCPYDWAAIFQNLAVFEESLAHMINAENIQFAITKEGFLKASE